MKVARAAATSNASGLGNNNNFTSNNNNINNSNIKYNNNTSSIGKYVRPIVSKRVKKKFPLSSADNSTAAPRNFTRKTFNGFLKQSRGKSGGVWRQTNDNNQRNSSLVEVDSYIPVRNRTETPNRVIVKRKRPIGGDGNRDSRFLSLFTVVTFPNIMCATTTQLNGTCYPSSDCANRRGTPQGSCASGFGVCCLFEYQCSRTTNENGTYFVNPVVAQPMCSLMVYRMNNDICQIRLELDLFEIGGPNAKGECADEFFIVSGGSRVPPICGVNSRQHLVYSITPDSGPSQLSVVLSLSASGQQAAGTSGGGDPGGIWNIRVYQYECTSPVLAPVGCLQYFRTVTDVVQSFNYKEDVSSAVVAGGSITGVNHLANMDYSACVRMEAGYCGIRWSQYPGIRHSD